MEKITKKQMYEGMVAYFRGEDTEITEGMFAEFCLAQIADLDKKAVKAKERAAAKRAEGDALTDAVLAVLTGEFQTAADVAAQIEDEDATVAKVSYRLGALVKDGKAVKEDIKVDREGKKAVLKGYKLV